MNAIEITRLIVDVLLALISAGLLKSWFENKKYQQEVAKLREEVATAATDRRDKELDNVKKANDILMQNVVEPLKTEINAVHKELTRLRRAIDKVGKCPHADNCPVRNELQNTEANG